MEKAEEHFLRALFYQMLKKVKDMNFWISDM